MIYRTRNLNNIAKLADNTKARALKLHQYCEDNKIEILIYDTIRTVEQQRKNVASGASKTMKSYHIVGQALDFVMVDKNGEALWGQKDYNSPNAKKVVAYAKSLGFTWGADWNNNGRSDDETFIDSPHLQYEYKGYGTDTFNNKANVVPPSNTNNPSTPNNNTLGLVDYLKSIGIDSSFANRSKLAVQYGIANYSGKAKQNEQLLAAIKKGSVAAPKPKPTEPKFTSLVDYLKYKGIDSSFNNRTKLAAQHGIPNYVGSAQQNTLLLNKLQK